MITMELALIKAGAGRQSEKSAYFMCCFGILIFPLTLFTDGEVGDGTR